MTGEPILGKTHPHPQWDYHEMTWARFRTLRRWAQGVADAFDAPVYLVGSALTKSKPRDIDVSVIFPYAEYVRRFGEPPATGAGDQAWGIHMRDAFLASVWRHHMDIQHRLKHNRIDLKVCPDTWWPEKDKLLLAAPRSGLY